MAFLGVPRPRGIPRISPSSFLDRNAKGEDMKQTEMVKYPVEIRREILRLQALLAKQQPSVDACRAFTEHYDKAHKEPRAVHWTVAAVLKAGRGI